MTSGTQTTWPTMAEFQEAVQAPSLCFVDGELKGGEPVLNALGLPRPICGQFASVYEVESGRHFAVKCFLRNIPDQHERYAKISDHLRSQNTDYFVTFEYQADGIKVRGKPYPLVKMEWVEAFALNEFIESNLENPQALLELERRWQKLLEDLKAIGVGHGDLQHGNVLVQADGSLRLIDYDGMWVPSLAGQTSHEIGHPDYQSPKRTETDFDAEVDHFAGMIIRLAIHALSIDASLWDKYDNGDNLLFRRQDYLKPTKSRLLAELRALGDPEIDAGLVELFGKVKSGPGASKQPKKAAEQPAEKTRPAEAPKPEKQTTQPAQKKRTQAVETAPAKQQPPQQGKKDKPKKHKKKLRGKRAKTRAALARKAANANAGGAVPSWLQDHVPASAGPQATAASAGQQAATKVAKKPAPGPANQPQAKAQAKTGTRSVKQKTQPAAQQPVLQPAQQPAPRQAKQPAPAPAPAKPAVVIGPRRSTRGRTFWGLVHLLAVLPLAVPAVAEALSLPAKGEPIASLPEWCFNVALGLGCASVLSQFVLPKIHRVLRLWFFGYLLPLLLLNLISIVMNGPESATGFEWTLLCATTGALILASLWVVIFGRKKRVSP